MRTEFGGMFHFTAFESSVINHRTFGNTIDRELNIRYNNYRQICDKTRKFRKETRL